MDVPTLEWDFAQNLYKNRAGDGHIKGCLYELQGRHQSLVYPVNIRLYDAYDIEGEKYIVEIDKARVHNTNADLTAKANLKKCKIGEQIPDLLTYNKSSTYGHFISSAWTDWITESTRSITFALHRGGVFTGTLKKVRHMRDVWTLSPKRIS